VAPAAEPQAGETEPASPEADESEPALSPEQEAAAQEAADSVATEASPLDLNQATYEDLRRLRLSVTQSGRVLAYRERLGGFKSLDELDSIPGFPRSFLTELKRRLTL
jgi:DNA uptake protein ComE-like DNA-binding protein